MPLKKVSLLSSTDYSDKLLPNEKIHHYTIFINKQNYSDAHANNNMTPATEVMLNWQKKMLMFDKMKSELESRQVWLN